ncbi:MAG: o-succinylbenzoate synthase [Lentisphaeria bacterium]|nr:o-succinylbenzoate synthase [Candidatus Neomarinimicrobiota bacterium]MCF7843011.1 o-succinylbenzoate synthase [Lentisphaeria bacterium]
MKIKHFDLFRYRLQFRQPIQLKQRTHTHRTGCLVKITTDSDFTGWGELAPLPGFSLETLEEATAAAHNFLTTYHRSALPGNFQELRNRLPMDLPASTAFGLATALMSIIAQAKHHYYLHQVFGECEFMSVQVNGLLPQNEKLTDVIERFNFHGFDVLKLKVGSPDVESDVELVKSIHSLAPGLKLRLDANRQWSLDDALFFANAIQGITVDYIEEPVNDPVEIAAFYSQSGMAIALDETLLQPAWQDLLPSISDAVSAFILKPTFLGHPDIILQLSEQAQAGGQQVIFTGAFESGIGTCAIAEMAGIWGTKNTAMGLNTHRRLAQDVLTSRLIYSGKFLEFHELPWPVNQQLLEPVQID